jgi:signal peptidase I
MLSEFDEADPDSVREARDRPRSAGRKAFEWLRFLLSLAILSLMLRSLVVTPFHIPSRSMTPNLLVGDYLFVAKWPYGYSRFSFPLTPGFIEGRIGEGRPERGDVIVFRSPADTDSSYVKRVIGLPGDRVQMIDGLLYINGAPVERELIEGNENAGGFSRTLRYRETLPNGVSYEILDTIPNGSADNTQEFIVPEGHYFMMGDNRDNSTDSRVPVERFGVGFVPAENLIGRAEVIFFSVEEDAHAWEFWRWPWTVRGDRLFTGL